MDDSGRVRWLRIIFLLERASRVLRELLKRRWLQTKGIEWRDTQENSNILIQDAQLYRDLTKKQIEVLEDGKSDNWDVSLLSRILLKYPWKITVEIEVENSKIHQLREQRNLIVHKGGNSVTETEFNNAWPIISSILVSFGDSKKEIDALKIGKPQELVVTKEQSTNDLSSKKANELKLKGNDAFGAQKFKEAIDLYSEALSVPSLSSKERAILYSNRSASYFGLEKWSKSYMDAKFALQHWPNWWKAYLRKGKAAYEMKKFEKALKAFDCGLLLNPTQEELKEARSEAYAKLVRQESYDHFDMSFLNRNLHDICAQWNASVGGNIQPNALVSMVESMAHEGDPESIGILGTMYATGAGKRRNLEEAVKHFSLAASKNNAYGMYNLGIMTLEGLGGLKKDTKLAISLFERAASQNPRTGTHVSTGVCDSMYALGTLYAEGRGVPKNLGVSIEYYTKAANLGHSASLNALGVLYHNGEDVVQDIRKAANYYEAAASKDDARAMFNLGYLYLGPLQDGSRACKWLERAAENGFYLAHNHMDNAQKLLTVELKIIERKNITKWEQSNALECDDMTPAERISRFLNATEPGYAATRNFMEKNASSSRVTPAKIFNLKADQPDRFDIELLQKLAENSDYACLLFQAKEAHLTACSLLLSSKSDENDLEIVENLAKCFRISEVVALNVNEWVHKFLASVDRILKKKSSHADANICYIHLTMLVRQDVHTLKYLAEYANKCIKQNPNDADLYNIRAGILAFLREWEEVKVMLTKAIELNPSRYDLYSLRGAAHRSTKHYKQAMKDYEYYLAHIWKDHRHVPEAYYSMGYCYTQPQDLPKEEAISEVYKYYLKGKEAEKNMLPCFLPFQSQIKEFLEVILTQSGKIQPTNQQSKSSSNNSTPSKEGSNTKDTNWKVENPRRIEIRREHRHVLSQVVSQLAGQYASNLTIEPPKTQKTVHSLVGLKEIRLKDIDSTKDHIYKGYVFNGTIIEFPLPMSAFHTVLEDDNGDVTVASFYNWKSPGEFKIGQRLAILNPYHRLASDGRKTLRVDDSKSVIMMDKLSICYYCSNVEEDGVKLSTCGQCKRVKYCSRQCQESDWRTLEHKLVCKHFKK